MTPCATRCGQLLVVRLGRAREHSLRSAARCVVSALPRPRSAPYVCGFASPQPKPVVTQLEAPRPRPSPRRRAAVRADAVAQLHLPKAPSDVVLRPRLFELLDAGVADCALTLVSGPPGAGKTVLLTSWLRERAPDARLVWISLHDPATTSFWRQLAEAVRPPRSRNPILASTDVPGDDPSLAFAEHFRAAAASLDEKLVVVVDDLHLTSAPALAALDRVLRTAPPKLRFVCASRIDPALGLHRLRLNGDLAEIRARDLAFAEPESADFLAGMGLELEEHETAAVVARTEGWAAGLRL